MTPNETITLRVSVTEEDIIHGETSNCESCPIARAASRATGRRVWVDNNDVDILSADCKRLRHASLPSEASDFVRMFDNHLPVQPFEFDLEVPAWILESEAA